jgi:hypothetical protein
VLVALLALAGAALAQEPRQGLLWNRSGLPAVFPLQVRTLPGADWYVELHDVTDGRAVMAAYFTGGEFFRVLVPPGEFTLHFASGTDWRGEADLFGAGTRRVVPDRTFRFAVRGLGTKSGHLVDLTDTEPGVYALLEKPEIASCAPAADAPNFRLPDLRVPDLRLPDLQPSANVSVAEAVGNGRNPLPLPPGEVLAGRADTGLRSWGHGGPGSRPGYPYRDASRDIGDRAGTGIVPAPPPAVPTGFTPCG